MKKKEDNLVNFTAVNPATGEALPAIFSEATADEIDSAVNKAEKAFLIYRLKSGAERAVFLERIGEEIMALGDELINLYGDRKSVV